jgi:hypothetical protein
MKNVLLFLAVSILSGCGATETANDLLAAEELQTSTQAIILDANGTPLCPATCNCRNLGGVGGCGWKCGYNNSINKYVMVPYGCWTNPYGCETGNPVQCTGSCVVDQMYAAACN